MVEAVVLYQGQSAVHAGIAGLLALATAELIAATAVTAAASKVSGWRDVAVLPTGLRSVRDRYAPRPLDVFLVATLCFIGVELALSRPYVAATVAGLCLGAFAVAVVLFEAFPEETDTDGEAEAEADDTDGDERPTDEDDAE